MAKRGDWRALRISRHSWRSCWVLKFFMCTGYDTVSSSGVVGPVGSQASMSSDDSLSQSCGDKSC